MTLKTIYNNFSKFLTTGKNDKLAASINEHAARLHIYQNNVISNRANAIKASYPAICAIVGEDFFKNFANLYAKTYPSYSGSLNDYADDFPEFIENNFNLHKLPYLADLALFEKFHHKIHVSEEEKNSDLFSNPEKLLNSHFTLKKNCYWQTSEFPIVSLYKFAKQIEASAPSLNKGETALIAKIDRKISIYSLTQEEIEFLDLLLDNELQLEQVFTHYHQQQIEERFSTLLEKLIIFLQPIKE